MSRPLAAAAALAILAGCAKGPDSIPPVSMGNAFARTTCGQAQALLIEERQRLAALESEQRSAVAGDAVGVFLIGVPLSSLSGGDKAGQIGASKGKIVALENRLVACA